MAQKLKKEELFIKDRLQEHNNKEFISSKEYEDKNKLACKSHHNKQQQVADEKNAQTQLQNKSKEDNNVAKQKAEKHRDDINHNNLIFNDKNIKHQQKISENNDLKNKMHHKQEGDAEFLLEENKQTQQMIETLKQNENLSQQQLKDNINNYDLSQHQLKLQMSKKQTSDYNIKQKKDKKQDDIIIENQKLIAETKPITPKFDVDIAIVEALKDPSYRIEIINHIVELIRQSRLVSLKDGLCNISIPGEFWEGTNVSVNIKQKDLTVKVNASENVESLLKEHRSLLCESLQSIDTDLNVAVSIDKLAT